MNASPRKEAARTAAKRVYLDLKKRVIQMEMMPGTRIVERDIAAMHATSRTPVHEAVQRLAEEGLIEVVPRVGTFVARIPLDQLEKATFLRTALEVAVVAKAAERIRPEDIARLRSMLENQKACVEASDHKGFHQCDEAFHAEMAHIAGMPGVWRIIQQTKTQVDRYRQLTLPLPGRMEHVVGEHLSIVEALANGGAQEAAVAMRAHLDLVLPIAKVAKSLRPEYFINHLPQAHEVDRSD